MRYKVILLLIFVFQIIYANAQVKITAEFYNAKLGTIIDALAKLENENIIWDEDTNKLKDEKVSIIIRKPLSTSQLFKTVLKEYDLTYLKNGNLITIKKLDKKLFTIPTEIVLSLGKETFFSIYSFIKSNLTTAGKIKAFQETNTIYVEDTKENIANLEKLFDAYINPLEEKAKKVAKEKELYSQLIKKEIKVPPDKFKEIEDELVEKLSPVGKYHYDKKTQILQILETKENYAQISKIIAKLNKVNITTKCFYVRSLEPNELLLNIRESYLSQYGSLTFKSKETQTTQTGSTTQTSSTATTNTAARNSFNINNNIITSLPKLCITDLPMVIEKIKNKYSGILINRPYQIVIEARIIQIQSSFIRNLGIQWGGNYTTSSAGVSYSTGSGFNTTFDPLTGQAGYNYMFDFPADGVSIGTGAAIGFLVSGAKGALDLRLSALEQIGKTQILSRPKVITIDGEPAEISQGIEIPYQSSSANLGTNVQFKEALLKLNVIPRTLPDGNIVMNITLTQDIPDFGKAVNGQPPINTKSITSRVVAKDGSTIVIGGILEKTDTTSTTGTPGLHRIPILGWLFKKKSIQTENRELLIFISPKIVYE
ncbi:pilus assembly protein PilQ [Hydrogenothermus marinus]|uniref:Type IV pilus assembly protein PilQ n=1 Tax=Hydrogenothermus marinus TaxID=133270 RepID=A0A3M0BZK2_9AQUI|nr:pilus assembly protein PilQ [Hydrogenothermus marinus]RMA96102.1 type IV pilus assembly protein PilQ [Hydrogenothermus marinus]